MPEHFVILHIVLTVIIVLIILILRSLSVSLHTPNPNSAATFLNPLIHGIDLIRHLSPILTLIQVHACVVRVHGILFDAFPEMNGVLVALVLES